MNLRSVQAEHARTDRGSLTTDAPVVDHTEYQYACDIVAGFLVRDRLDPDIRVQLGTFLAPLGYRRFTGIVGRNRQVRQPLVAFKHLPEMVAAQTEDRKSTRLNSSH